MLEEFPYIEEVRSLKRVNTPAAQYLFVTIDRAEKVGKKKQEEFHTTLAKGLFSCKRARPDIQPTIPFLCTRVQETDLRIC
jgi:hypothetical protein